MPVPKKKTSRSVRNMRRSHDALKNTAAVELCPTCGEPKLRHNICKACGTYRGRQVLPSRVAAAPVDEVATSGEEQAPPTE